jgi:protein-L-isoaspartate(D-aspartate) O-methyltransferase
MKFWFKIAGVLIAMGSVVVSTGMAPDRPVAGSAASLVQRLPPLAARSTMEARKPAYIHRIEAYLKGSLGSVDPRVVKAFQTVPREYFMYNYETNRSLARYTYESHPHPWAIGYGSYLSDYRAQAYMTQLLHPNAGDTSLEIGTGSGFQTAILSRLVSQAYTIEIISALGHKVDRIYAPLGYTNVHARVGDGFYGWPQAAGKFDDIIVTCAAPFVPPALIAQLKDNGRMVIPIGQPYKTQFLYVFTKDARGRVHSRRDIPTYFIPMNGLGTARGAG